MLSSKMLGIKNIAEYYVTELTALKIEALSTNIKLKFYTLRHLRWNIGLCFDSFRESHICIIVCVIDLLQCGDHYDVKDLW